MGFDLNIIINTDIDATTGLPFVWSKKLKHNCQALDCTYEPSVYQIPEKYRKYIHQRGHHFHYYILYFDDTTTQCDVEIFLNYYPEWSDNYSNDDWTIEDHNEFKECLQWLTSQSGIFGIRWSY